MNHSKVKTRYARFKTEVRKPYLGNYDWQTEIQRYFLTYLLFRWIFRCIASLYVTLSLTHQLIPCLTPWLTQWLTNVSISRCQVIGIQDPEESFPIMFCKIWLLKAPSLTHLSMVLYSSRIAFTLLKNRSIHQCVIIGNKLAIKAENRLSVWCRLENVGGCKQFSF